METVRYKRAVFFAKRNSERVLLKRVGIEFTLFYKKERFFGKNP